MTARDYRIFCEGRKAAAGGAGLSDSPYGGRDGDLWRQGVADHLREHEADGEVETDRKDQERGKA